jgi:hypothetical protein
MRTDGGAWEEKRSRCRALKKSVGMKYGVYDFTSTTIKGWMCYATWTTVPTVSILGLEAIYEHRSITQSSVILYPRNVNRI